MSNLHAHFALRNEQAFARSLDASRSQATIDVNARDWLGRTVLHLASASPEPFALSCVKLLLAHPAINVNVQDAESRWTALHRALYAGNLPAVILLLQRTDTDVNLRDHDGYTPFDLYNSTVYGTSPHDYERDFSGDLFTWGINRNAALGHGDASDRSHPDQVPIHPATPLAKSPARFTPIRVQDVAMAKLHTIVITDEPRGNLRMCGFGSGGRLGAGQHTQYSLQPVPQLTARIVSVALGQDHTLALSDAGEVLSWGLNRFSQLGYAIDREEPVQTTPRRVLGLLRKKHVSGVAACRSASACWTASDVFTWGTNGGQLGYDSAAQPVQGVPRKVTGVQNVVQIALTESAMVCLLSTLDVICFRADAHFRVKFPAPDFTDIPFPHVLKPDIIKITSTDGVFAALSSRGDIFTFPAPPPPSEADPRPAIKPQRVWSLRKSFDPAIDVALGGDGALIVCTKSGRVFVRARPGAKAVRMPYVHCAVRVCANCAGAFAALRRTPSPRSVKVLGTTIAEDVGAVRPWILDPQPRAEGVEGSVEDIPSMSMGDVEDEEDDPGLEADVATTLGLCALLAKQKGMPPPPPQPPPPPPPPLHGRHGADVPVHVGAGMAIPAHRAILAARSPTLRALFEGKDNKTPLCHGDVKLTCAFQDGIHITVAGCHPMTVLLLLEYVYTDCLPAIWDRRVGGPCGSMLARVGAAPQVIKTQLAALARLLDLPALSASLVTAAKRVPASTLARDMSRLFHEPTTDVVLELADRGVVRCHAVVLRARSLFFRGFFDEEVWTVRRWRPVVGGGGEIVVDMKHVEWRAVRVVMQWMYGDEEEEGLFERLIEDVDSVAELLELVFEVMAVASELLLDKLMLICSSVILRHVTLHNVTSLLADAAYFNALDLVSSLHEYITTNLEAILETRLLLLDDDHDAAYPDLVQELATAVREWQTYYAPATRTNRIGAHLMDRHREWLEMQDIPIPVVRSQRPPLHRESPRLEPVEVDKDKAAGRRPPPTTPLSSPMAPAAKPSTPKAPYGEEIFAMEDDVMPALNIGLPQSPPTTTTTAATTTTYTLPPPAWRSKPIQIPGRVDMKVIMAEAETQRDTVARDTVAPRTSGTRVVGFDVMEEKKPKVSQKQSQRDRRKQQQQTQTQGLEETMGESAARASTSSSSSGSPWRLPGQQKAASSSSSSSVSPPLGSTVTPRSSPAGASRSPGSNTSPTGNFKGQPATPMSIFQASSSPSLSAAPHRRSSADLPAWTKPPAPSSSSVVVSTSGVSFADIQQQQQRDQGQGQGPGQRHREKRSLLEIQDEERARREEEEFLKWWAAEEQRMKAEAAARVQVQNVAATTRPPGKRGRGTRRGGTRRGSYSVD